MRHRAWPSLYGLGVDAGKGGGRWGGGGRAGSEHAGAGLLFDAYGTLFDVHSVVAAGRAVTERPAAAVGALAPEAARVHVAPEPHGALRGLLDRHRVGARVRVPAARSSARMPPRASASWTPTSRSTRSPRCRPCSPGCGTCRAPSCRTARRACSRRSSAHNRLGDHLRAVISVDAVRTFKPHPAVYALGARPARARPGHDRLRVLERLGRRRGQGVRVPGHLGEPPGRAPRGAGSRA